MKKMKKILALAVWIAALGLLCASCDNAGFNVRKHGLKARSLEVRTRIAIVRVPAQLGKAVLLCVGFKDTLLVGHGITFDLQLVPVSYTHLRQLIYLFSKHHHCQ